MNVARLASTRLQLTASLRFFTSGAGTLPQDANPAVIFRDDITKKLRVRPYYDDEEQPPLDGSAGNRVLFLDFPAFSGGVIIVHDWCCLPYVFIKALGTERTQFYGYPFADVLTQFAQDMGGLDYAVYGIKGLRNLPPIAIPIPNVSGPVRMAIAGWGDPGAAGVVYEIYNPRRLPIEKGVCTPYQVAPLVNNANGVYVATSLSEYDISEVMMPAATIDIHPTPLSAMGYVFFVGSEFPALTPNSAAEMSATVPRREIDFDSIVVETAAQVTMSYFYGGIAHYPAP